MRRDRKIGSVLIGASVAVAGFDNLFLVPALIGYASAHGGRLPFGGFGGTLRAIIRTPGQFWTCNHLPRPSLVPVADGG